MRIHSISTVVDGNVDEIRRLTTYLYERCPRMDHHNIAIIRGDRKDASLQGPALDAYRELYRYTRRLWADREEGRFGAIVDPMLTWAKLRTAEERRMVIPCKAGVLSGVVYANGDVAVCETAASYQPIGNLRQKSFREIWFSPEADAQRNAIRCKECHCTNEVFLWPSLTFQPLQLVRAMAGSRVWEKPDSLPEEEREKVALGPDLLPLVRLGVEVRETNPLRRQLVKAGSGIEAPVATQVTPADVVDQHEHDVRLVSHCVCPLLPS